MGYQFIETEEEKVADIFAKNILINADEYNEFMKKMNIRISDIKFFATLQNIKLVIVIGKIQKDIDDYSFMASIEKDKKGVIK